MKVMLISPRFFDRKFGERRAMMSAYKTALTLSKHVPVTVVTAGPPPRYEKVNKNLGVYRFWDLYLPDPINLGIPPGLFLSLPGLIRRERPDVFLINKHMFIANLAAPFLRLFGRRVIIQTDTFPGINWFPRHPLVKLVMQIYAWTLGMLVLKSANKVVLLHEGLIPTAQKLKLPYTVIHNGVDVAAFNRAKPAADLIKKEHEVFVAYVGRLESVKGYTYFLEVARKLADKYPHLKFFVVGNTSGKEDVVQSYAGKQIVFTGHRQDIPAVLKKMNILVMPSYSEGLPNALMEAMAVGCVPVASRVGGVPIVVKDGEEGLLFEPGDRADLRQKLERLVTDTKLRQEMSQRAVRRIRESFNIEREILKLLHILQDHGQNQPV